METQKISIFMKITIALLPSFITAIAIYWVYIYMALLFEGIFYHQDIIIFNKTAMYMLGVSILFFFITIFGIRFLIKNKQVPNKKIYAYIIMYIPLIIMFIFPQIISFFVHQHIDKIHYIECKEQSTFQFNYTKYVFAKDLATCQQYKR